MEPRDYKYREVVDELARAKGSLVHFRSASQSGVQVMSMQLGVPPIVVDCGRAPRISAPRPQRHRDRRYDGLSRAIDALADPSQAEVKGRIALNMTNDTTTHR